MDTIDVLIILEVRNLANVLSMPESLIALLMYLLIIPIIQKAIPGLLVFDIVISFS